MIASVRKVRFILGCTVVQFASEGVKGYVAVRGDFRRDPEGLEVMVREHRRRDWPGYVRVGARRL